MWLYPPRPWSPHQVREFIIIPYHAVPNLFYSNLLYIIAPYPLYVILLLLSLHTSQSTETNYAFCTSLFSSSLFPPVSVTILFLPSILSLPPLSVLLLSSILSSHPSPLLYRFISYSSLLSPPPISSLLAFIVLFSYLHYPPLSSVHITQEIC